MSWIRSEIIGWQGDLVLDTQMVANFNRLDD